MKQFELIHEVLEDYDNKFISLAGLMNELAILELYNAQDELAARRQREYLSRCAREDEERAGGYLGYGNIPRSL